MPNIGGFPVYVQKCNEAMDLGYEGFIMDGKGEVATPPRRRPSERWHVTLDIEVIAPAIGRGPAHAGVVIC